MNNKNNKKIKKIVIKLLKHSCKKKTFRKFNNC